MCSLCVETKTNAKGPSLFTAQISFMKILFITTRIPEHKQNVTTCKQQKHNI